MQRIVIIGAGPAGLLLAHYLLNQVHQGDYQIDIYDSHSDPRSPLPLSPATLSQRGFPIALQARGLNALAKIPPLYGAVTAQGIWTEGTVLHNRRGKQRKMDRKTPLLLMSRQGVVEVLLTELLKTHGDAVKVHFGCECVEIAPQAQRVTLQTIEGEASGATFEIDFDRLIATDGANSQVRTSLTAQGLLDSTKEVVSDVYKSIFVSRISEDGSVVFDPLRLHGWNLPGGIRLIMAPQQGDHLVGTLIFPPDRNPFADLKTPEEVLSYFEQNMPSLRPLITAKEAEAIWQRPISTLATVKCDRLHVGNRIVIMGDAAHAVSPSIGQGCNSALEDASIFAELLAACQGDWDQAIPGFTQRRLADVHALRDLSDYTFPRSQVMRLELIFQITIGKKLRPLFPKLFRPLPMELVMAGDRPYSEILQECQGWIDRVRGSIPKQKAS